MWRYNFIIIVFILCISCQRKDSSKTLVGSQGSLSSPFGPTSITRDVQKDKHGNLWLATWEGIIQFNGDKFINITKNEGMGLARAFDVHEDKKGNIWFATVGNGVLKFDGKTYTNYTSNEGLGSDRSTHIYEDKIGNLWFGTEGGLSRFNGTSIKNFSIKDGLPHNDVNTIIEDENNNFWIGTRGNACIFDGTSFTTLIGSEGKSFENIRSIHKDQKGRIWLGGKDGLWRFDGQNYLNMSSFFTGYIFEDSKGHIWTSSESEEDWVITRYDENLTTFQLKPEVSMLFGINEDRNGNIWFGTLNGVGRYDGKSFHYFKDPNLEIK